MEYDIKDYVAPNADAILDGIFHNRCIFSAIFFNSPSPVYIMSSENVLLVVNKPWEEIIGIPKEIALGKTLRDLFPPAVAAAFEAQNKEILEEQKILRTEEEIHLESGTVYLQTTKFPIACYPGGPVAVGGLSVNITKQKIAELAALKQREIAEKASLAKSEFLANMSHEIRTPLNGVMGMIGLAQEMADNEKQAMYLNFASIAAKNLMDVISDILDITKIESGKMSVDHKAFSLRHILSQAMNGLVGLALDKNIQINYDIKKDTPDTLIGDDTKTKQIINNLVGNAIKFTKVGYVSVHVAPDHSGGGNDDCRMAPDGSKNCTIRFSVRDTGIGIPTDKLKTIFESFEQIQSDLTITQGGTGLGLAISKRFVEMMGGRIWVESELGKGSTFYFAIPFDLPPT